MEEEIRRAKENWQEETLKPALNKVPERRAPFSTSSDIPVKRLYLPDQSRDYLQQIGFPGQYPYTRGVQPTMYRGRLWTMRQYAGFASAEETNKRFHYLLQQGQTGLSVAFDLPTQIGYDADNPMASGEVGRVGVSISSLEDMTLLLQGIPLDKVSTSMTINSPASILLAMYVAVGNKQGVEPHQLRGTIQNDILKEYIARGTYIYPPKPAMRLITDVFKYCHAHVPRWNTISISGYHMREAGATAVQEVAFTLANAVAYVEAALGAGLALDEFAPRLTFFFSAHNHFLEEIAKFRAARRLWARIMRERFGAKNPKSCLLRFHTQTAGSTLTAQQPYNNIIRVSLQALAAVLGGTQSLHTNSMDEALGLPTEEAARIALRTQQIIAYESGSAETTDPLGGSYALESLTDEVEGRSEEYLQQIEDMGGARVAVERGFFQREIHESAYRAQKDIEAGDSIVVGVNAFETSQRPSIEIHGVDPRVERIQVERLEDLRSRRDQSLVSQLLDELAEKAMGEENLVPHFVRSVQSGVTLGEICGRLRDVWGEYQPPDML